MGFTGNKGKLVKLATAKWFLAVPTVHEAVKQDQLEYFTFIKAR